VKQKRTKTRHNGRALFSVFLFFALGLLSAAPCFAQDRGRLTVYVPVPTGGTAQQRAYFQTNFKMELIGANYPSVETRAEAVYTLSLEIEDNPNYDREQPEDWAENAIYQLGVKLERNSDNAEIVRFNFPFNDTESMSEWNLYLLYQALANAYVPPEEPPEKPEPPPPVILPTPHQEERWCSQWLYLNMETGADLGFFLRKEDGLIDTAFFAPALLVGLEWHFLSPLSIEVDVKPRLMENYALTMAAAATMRLVFRPSTVMLELYGGAEYAMGLLGAQVPVYSAIAGVQAGVRGAAQSAWVLDIGVTRNLMEAYSPGNGKEFDLTRIHLLAGFKFGFIDRRP
jgi:hypothetical protein